MNNNYTWFLLTLSAVLYSSAFLMSRTFWWLIFLFPIPLFLIVLHKRLSFLHGYLWALLVLILHLSGVIHGIFLMSQGNLFLRVFPGIFILLYEALYGGIWFWLMALVRKKLKLKLCSPSNLLLWVMGLCAWTYFMDHYSLWIFGVAEGYLFMHPLVPLAEKPALLCMLPILGKQLLSLGLYVVGASTTALIVWPQKITVYILYLCIMPWLIFYMYCVPRCQKPICLSCITPFQISYSSAKNIRGLAQQVDYDFYDLLEKKPVSKVVIYPESAFYERGLFQDDPSKLFDCPIYVITGSFINDNDNTYNCLYVIYKGEIQLCYKKRHAMPLTERLPYWLCCSSIKNLFFKEQDQIMVSSNLKPIIDFGEMGLYVPYICSELFFNDMPDDPFLDVPILCIANDRWCSLAYVSRLMYLAAYFKAVQWQRSILYVSYHYACFIDCAGFVRWL